MKEGFKVYNHLVEDPYYIIVCNLEHVNIVANYCYSISDPTVAVAMMNDIGIWRKIR